MSVGCSFQGDAVLACGTEKQAPIRVGLTIKIVLKMKKVFSLLLLVAALFCGSVMAQNNMKDVVYLKNGGVVRGIIVEQVPGVSIKIQTADGNIFVYKIEEVERMTKEAAGPQRNYNNNYSGGYGEGYKNPTSAWCWSFFITGAGQMYNGQVGKGIGMLLGSLALNGVGSALVVEGEELGLLCYAGVLGLWVWSQIDAPATARRINAQNGYTFNLGDRTQLGLMPTMDYRELPLATTTGATFTPGLKVSLSF